MSTINVKIEFGGGLELLFSNQRSHRVSIPSHIPAPSSSTITTPAGVPPSSADSTDTETTPLTRPSDITYLISWLKDNLLQERAELFVENGTVRPGILVLVNDTDWELEGEGDYQLKDGDEVVFISTLHGG